MTNCIPVRVQLDSYFYNIIGDHQGGFGRVWLLERPEGAEVGAIYGKHRAVKTFEGQDQAAVVAELSNWILLHHPSILPLIKISRLNFRIAAMMEMRQGTLEDVLLDRTLSWEGTRTVLIQVCDALRYAYEQHQLAHLDIKPSNILIDDLPYKVQVSDWGISRLMHKGKISGPGAGTPRYVAPERLQDKRTSGAAADIFAVGMVAIYALSGMLPYLYLNEAKAGTLWQQTSVQLLSGAYYQHAQKILNPFSRAIRDVVLSCIHPNPAQRHGDYDKLLDVLRRVAA